MKLVLVVTALAVSGSLGCAGSTARPACASLVSVSAPRPLAIRAEAGALWQSAGAWAEPHRAWRMPARGAIEALAIDPAVNGYVVTFRQGGVAWRGELDASRAARGPLTPIPDAPAPQLPDAGDTRVSTPRGDASIEACASAPRSGC